MWSRIPGLEEGGELQFRAPWPPGVLVALIGVAVAFAIFLYWRERALPPGRRLFLAGLRAFLYALLLTLLFEPVLSLGRNLIIPGNVLVLTDVSESMNISDPRRSPRELQEAALALEKVPFASPRLQAALAGALPPMNRLTEALSRWDPPAWSTLAEESRRALEEALEKAREEALREGATEESPATERVRGFVERQTELAEAVRAIDTGQSDQARRLLGEQRELSREVSGYLNALSERIPAVPDDVVSEVSTPSRLELARGILRHPALAIFQDPGEETRIRYFRFGEHLEPTTGEGEALQETLESTTADSPVTRLGDAIEEAVRRYSGQSIDGVLLLTDGASNEGMDPLEVASRLEERSIPVYPVGLGLPRPDDIALANVIVQDTVFEKDRVPVQVEVTSLGYDGRSVEVTATLDGVDVARESLILSGGAQLLELEFVPEGQGGAARLEVGVTTQTGEISDENNQVTRTLEILDEKIRVLYVEGRPRWEYRYLRAVLLRDQRLQVKFLLTEGDPDLPRASPEHIARFPEARSEADRYDLVILGDVPSYYFTPSQMDWIAELVQTHGGSLLVLAGSGYGPATFRDTPIERILPVNLSGEGWVDVGRAGHPVVTADGRRSLMAQLESSDERTAAIWSLVRPLYRLPRVDGVKPGATVLVTLSEAAGGSSEPYPLVAWQRYGTGKSLFVATDQLWRLRFRQGDRYHARFWGQAIRFLTLSRLLGENKRIRLETSSREYRAGERVEVFANVLSDTYEPLELPTYSVELDGTQLTEPRPLTLAPVPGVPGLYRGSFRAGEEGSYRLSAPAADSSFSRPVEFTVRAASREQIEPAMQAELLAKMAALSGGRMLEIRDLPVLPGLLRTGARTLRVEEERELWDHWSIILVVLLCVGLEWFLRRRHDLA